MAEHRWNKEIEAKIIAKAWKDENFRNKLLKNPKEAFREWDLELPKDAEIKVLEEDPKHFYFILPKAPANVVSLSEHELERIAAAGCGPSCGNYGTVTAC